MTWVDRVLGTSFPSVRSAHHGFVFSHPIHSFPHWLCLVGAWGHCGEAPPPAALGAAEKYMQRPRLPPVSTACMKSYRSWVTSTTCASAWPPPPSVAHPIRAHPTNPQHLNEFAPGCPVPGAPLLGAPLRGAPLLRAPVPGAPPPGDEIPKPQTHGPRRSIPTCSSSMCAWPKTGRPYWMPIG